MSYAKAMKHWNNPRKHKLTAARIRGNLNVYGIKLPSDQINKMSSSLKGK
jgi:hypothetical protein